MSQLTTFIENEDSYTVIIPDIIMESLNLKVGDVLKISETPYGVNLEPLKSAQKSRP